MTRYLLNAQIAFCAGRLSPLGARPAEIRRPRRSRAPRARLVLNLQGPAQRTRW